MKENENADPVPYIVHESILFRAERTAKRLCYIIVLLILMLAGTNLAWLYAWCQYDYTGETTQTITVDGKSGTANFIGNNGSVVNGKDHR
mgnify:CR=1 FL=1